MEQNNKIKKIINNFLGKDVLIIQDGTIESMYDIHELKYEIKTDICNIRDKETENYLKFNLNQIYKIEDFEDYIKIYFDNDVNIKLLIKK